MSILNYQNLTLTYNEQEILHHIDLMIPKNQITVIVGQSGSGKSTLLKATMGLLSDDAKIIEGKILFEEDNLLATGVEMEAYSVEDNGKGIKFNVFVYNIEDGIIIDYKTGDSKLAN